MAKMGADGGGAAGDRPRRAAPRRARGDDRGQGRGTLPRHPRAPHLRGASEIQKLIIARAVLAEAGSDGAREPPSGALTPSRRPLTGGASNRTSRRGVDPTGRRSDVSATSPPDRGPACEGMTAVAEDEGGRGAAPMTAPLWTTTVKIRFAHCDPAGIVDFAAHFDILNGVVEDWFSEGLGPRLSRHRRAGGGWGSAMSTPPPTSTCRRGWATG